MDKDIQKLNEYVINKLKKVVDLTPPSHSNHLEALKELNWHVQRREDYERVKVPTA